MRYNNSVKWQEYMNRYAAIICIPLLLVIGLAVGCIENRGKEVHEVAFDHLCANPGHYNGKYVTIEGFYFHGFEVVVLSERLEYSACAKGHLTPEGRMAWIEGEIPREVYDQLYQQAMMGPEERYGKLKLTGEFQCGGKYGHLGAYNSQIIPMEVVLLQWSPPAQQ
jgi:hypothetical protein